MIRRLRFARDDEILLEHRLGDAELPREALSRNGRDFVRAQDGALAKHMRQLASEEHECRLPAAVDVRHVRLDERDLASGADPADQLDGLVVCRGSEATRVPCARRDVRLDNNLRGNSSTWCWYVNTDRRTTRS